MTDFSEEFLVGVCDQWVTYRRVLKDLRLGSSRNMDAARAYNSRQEPSNVNNVVPDTAYYAMGAQIQLNAIAAAFEGSDQWKLNLADALLYRTFGNRLCYFWHYQFDILFPSHKQPLADLSFASMTESMAFAFMLGQTEQAVYQGYLTYATLNCQYQLGLEYRDGHCRAQAFMLRLFADWREDGLHHEWPSWAYDTPVYNGILERWREPDPQILAPWLLAACDRHTHEGRYSNSKTYYDFGDQRTARTPLEIHFIFRLRELIGLSNPQLDHPLMAPPFDRLPETQPPLEPDELMQATLARVREDWPHFDGVTSLEALMRHPSKPGRLR